jgi:hypothetical protein
MSCYPYKIAYLPSMSPITAVEGRTRLQSCHGQGEVSVNTLTSADQIFQSQATISVPEVPAKPTSELITASPAGKLRFMNHDLPSGTYKKWTNTFILSYFEYMGVQCNPFSVSSKEAASAMQDAWDVIQPDTPFVIEPCDCVFVLVSPCF